MFYIAKQNGFGSLKLCFLLFHAYVQLKTIRVVFVHLIVDLAQGFRAPNIYKTHCIQFADTDI